MKFKDVKFIGWRISFTFRLKKVAKSDILDALVPEMIQEGGNVSYKNIRDILSNMPFNISDRKELDLLSQYLIEDEDSDEEISGESEQRVVVVKSIFKQLLGNYEGKEKRDYDNCNKLIIDVIPLVTL